MKSVLIITYFLLFCYFPIFGQTIRINEIMSSNQHTLADEDGDFVDWVELYNNSDFAVSLEGYQLTDNDEQPNKWIIPPVIIEPYDFFVVYTSGKDRVMGELLHTNFKLKSRGEEIILTNAEGEQIDRIEKIRLFSDQSYGRLLDGEASLYFLSNPTPGASNNAETYISQIEFSHESGFYDNPFYLILNSPDSIYYTLDGSIPDLSSSLYLDSLFVSSGSPNQLSLIPTNSDEIESKFKFNAPSGEINKAMILNAMPFRDGSPSGPVFTQTYFTNNKRYSVPVVSLVTSAQNLFDPTTGIYVPGESYDPENSYSSGNYNQRGIDWEKNTTMEYFNEKGNSKFTTAVGLRIAGGRSRNYPQKSLRLYFRREYGASKMDYSFFKDKPAADYKRLILRSSSSAWWEKNTLFQDEIIHAIVHRSGSKLDIQASQPVVVFLNGEYWGIHNLRERQDEHYLANNHSIEKDSVDIVGGNLVPIHGSNADLIEMIGFIAEHDLSDQSNFDIVADQIDVESVIDYFIFETYFGNKDWPGNNSKLWRTRQAGGKWKFMLYDMDATAGNVYDDPFDFSHPKQQIVKIFEGLCQNKAFEKQFLDRYVYLLETSLAPENVQKIYNEFRFYYSKEVTEHSERWGTPGDYEDWEESCRYFMDFMETRPCIITQHLIRNFDLVNLNNFDCLYDASVDFVRAFPNPGNGYLNLVFEEEGDIEGGLELYNVRGELVFTQPLQNGNHQAVDFSFLGSGIYLLRINCNGEIETEKIVIQN